MFDSDEGLGYPCTRLNTCCGAAWDFTRARSFVAFGRSLTHFGRKPRSGELTFPTLATVIERDAAQGLVTRPLSLGTCCRVAG